jgi:tetratricopeptide (TPR) repeat protein
VNIGNVYQRLGDNEKALFHFNTALPVLESQLGASHVSVARTHGNMGCVYESLGDYEKARFHHDKALEIKLKCLGRDHASVAMTKENIAIVHKALGNHNQARQLYKEAHDIFLQSLGPAHLNTQKAARALQALSQVTHVGPTPPPSGNGRSAASPAYAAAYGGLSMAVPPAMAPMRAPAPDLWGWVVTCCCVQTCRGTATC